MRLLCLLGRILRKLLGYDHVVLLLALIKLDYNLISTLDCNLIKLVLIKVPIDHSPVLLKSEQNKWQNSFG
jgi:hypothetical protein